MGRRGCRESLGHRWSWSMKRPARAVRLPTLRTRFGQPRSPSIVNMLRRFLSRRRRRCVRFSADLTFSHFRSDEPVDELLSTRSRTAQLVVLGSDDVSPATALLAGSTTLAATAHSACPVIAWRGSNAVPTDQPIVLGVDGDRTGEAAFKAAFEFADRFGVGLNAVHA